MTMFDYIKTIYPILENSNFEKIVKIICETFDHLHELNYEMIANYFVHSCDDIKQKASEQSILIFPLDTEEILKEKTYTSYKFLKHVTTKSGIKEIISKYYFKEFNVFDCKELGNFILNYSYLGVDSLGGNGGDGFVVQVFEELDNKTRNLLKTILDKIKPCHIDYYIEELFDFPIFELGISTLNYEVLS